jgi:hypothetical protein
MDTEDGSALLGDRCPIQNQVTTTTKPLRRGQKPPSTRRDFFMDGRQQNINLTHRDAEIKKEIKETSQIQILHHNVQSLKNKLMELCYYNLT